MAPQYKLTYFNLKGRGEPSRLLLAHANIEYVDCRVESSDWPELKAKMPWGKMPVLEVLEGDSKGFVLSDSIAILNYLARKHGLAGESDEDKATCNEYIGAINDLATQFVAVHYEKNEEKKAELGAKFFEGSLPPYLDKFSAIIKANGNFLVGNGLTLADIFVGNFLQRASVLKPGLLNNYPTLREHQNTVFESSPGIKKWVAERPAGDW